MTVKKQLAVGPQSDGTWRDVVAATGFDGTQSEWVEIWPHRPPWPWQSYKVVREEWDDSTTPPTRRILEVELA